MQQNSLNKHCPNPGSNIWHFVKSKDAGAWNGNSVIDFTVLVMQNGKTVIGKTGMDIGKTGIYFTAYYAHRGKW